MIAGYDTTSLTISNCIHVLAMHPDEAQKVQEEIDLQINEIGDCDYDTIGKLEYMDLFIKEVLRMYPVANR
jgi:cytochrome P450 family 6